jgi:DNA-binding MarR family transcriptional regulator/ribosomal protein S18 acetylase RimI-like enzyme
MAVVEEVRRFNRFYTGVIGVLDEGLVATPWSLTESRVLYELASTEAEEVADLRRAVGIDAGYLSRVLGRLAGAGLVTRSRSAEDTRRGVVRLTAAGRAAFDDLDRRTVRQVESLLEGLAEDERRRLVGAMAAIRDLLEDGTSDPAVVLHPPGPGDLGWVVQRNAAVYAEQYGWDAGYEALVARIVAEFAERAGGPDGRREAAWIAEVDGERAGCVLCVAREGEPDVAQLRLLLVEPRARGRGLGSRLVEECLRFARRHGYRRMVLWTNDVLVEARRIYERAGFELLESAPHHSFGHDLVGQWWARDL